MSCLWLWIFERLLSSCSCAPGLHSGPQERWGVSKVHPQEQCEHAWLHQSCQRSWTTSQRSVLLTKAPHGQSSVHSHRQIAHICPRWYAFRFLLYGAEPNVSLCLCAAILNELLQRENRVLHFWTLKKRRLDQCQQFVVFERSAKQVSVRHCWYHRKSAGPILMWRGQIHFICKI